MLHFEIDVQLELSMNRIRAIQAFVLCLCLSAASGALAGSKDIAVYTELVDASHFVKNYKRTASETAAIFAARGRGNDKQFAAFLAKVAKADLSDFKICISGAYATGPLTVGDAKELIKVFRSSAGQRVLDLSQQMLVADMRRGYHEPLDPSRLSESDRQDIVSLYKMPVFQRYGAFISSPAFKSAIQTCLVASKVGRDSGL